ncbi:hypothetical protein OH809_24955 [Streptomyces sp. NBC_00873]|uniref:hypothetical protein n=1 Tax=Streptomyces sp. NBC_00873 TaxID=2975852 RepID=UPI00386379CA|nr:hypothetical protein OH809_24955 [Streptomyces sp. NBC_00873]
MNHLIDINDDDAADAERAACELAEIDAHDAELAAEDAAQPKAVHRFGDTWEAYDATQCRDDIADGDVLVIESEQVVGFLVEAWPVAITEAHGEFHRLTASVQEFKDGRYVASAERAAELAGELGFPMRQSVQTA